MVKINKVVLIGRLTKDPELKFTLGTGTAVVQITIAVDRRFKKEDSEREADFIPIVVWGKQAEAVANYTVKGRLIGVSGRIQTRSYDVKDGTKRYVTEVVADEIQFIEWAKNSSNSENGSMSTNHNEYGSDLTPVDDGDIPF